MPFKVRQFYNRRRKTPKLQPKRDWSDYNKKMKMRGDITIWLSPDVIDQWTIVDRHYDGSGTPLLFSDMAIMTVHEIRQVFKLPLRQCEGFVNGVLGIFPPKRTKTAVALDKSGFPEGYTFSTAA